MKVCMELKSIKFDIYTKRIIKHKHDPAFRKDDW